MKARIDSLAGIAGAWRACAVLLLFSVAARRAAGDGVSIPDSGSYEAQALDVRQPLPLAFDIVAAGLVSPVVLTHAGDGSGRLFIAEQTGQIRIVDAGGQLLPAPFLDLSAAVVPLNPGYDERGLLGLAFHPAYAGNGRFFVYGSAAKSGPGVNHESILAEFAVSPTDPNLANTASGRIVLRVDQPEANHNGGALAFGPDGYLYIALGDGGGGGDAHGAIGNAQDTTTLLGSILRINVDSTWPYAIPPDNPFVGSPGRDEIWAFGFRNPWGISFDAQLPGILIVADVGQNRWEELNAVRAGGNHGWRIVEGRHAYDLGLAETLGLDPALLNFPVHEYQHGPLGIAVVGGYIYRGNGYPALQGRYVFGDFSTSFGTPDGAIYYLASPRPGVWEQFEFALPGGGLGRYVKGFGRDERGELYVLSSLNPGPSGTSGDVRRLRRP